MTVNDQTEVTPKDNSVAIYTDRLRLAVWRSYGLQVVACVSGALIAWCAARCALDDHYGWSAICASMLVLNAATFSYAARDRTRAHKVLEMLVQ